MTDQTNVVPMALPLSKLAEQLREDIVYTNQGREQWIEGMLRQAQHLREARERFGDDDSAFGKWLRDEKIEIGENDRTALITMGANPEKMRTILTQQPKMLHANTILKKEDIGTFGKIPKVSKSPFPAKRGSRINRRVVRAKQTDQYNDEIIGLADSGVSSTEIASKIGVDGRAIRHVIEAERTRREALGIGAPEVQDHPRSRRGRSRLPEVMREDNEGIEWTRAAPQPLPPPREFGPIRALMPEQVDPDFKGTAIEFATKYGHVTLHTKEQIEQNNQQELLSAWLGAVADQERIARIQLEAFAKVKPDTLAAWLRKPGKREKLQGWVDSIQRAYDVLHALTNKRNPSK